MSMNAEEWQFTALAVGGGIIAAAIIINDVFSIQKFWARSLRSRRPLTREALERARTRHQRFYHRTQQRLFSTTYVSFYLFALSLLGIILIDGFVLIRNVDTNERTLRLFYTFFFLLVSRWYYRQESHHTTAHYLFAVLSCVILIDLFHLLTKADYLQATLILTMCWMWAGGILRATLQFESAYARGIAYSWGLPFALGFYLVTSNSLSILFIFAQLFLGVVVEELFRPKFTFFHPLPFKPEQPHSFLKDVFYSLLPRETFRGCPLLEVLYWFSLTPFVLVPVTHYLQGREETLLQRRHNIILWSKNEYVLSPETVADRVSLTLEDTYPLLNELVEEGILFQYESPYGLFYTLPPSEEMDAFIQKFSLLRSDLPKRDRDFMEYLREKTRTKPPTAALLQVIKTSSGIEISIEPAGGTLSPLKPSIVVDAPPLEKISRDFTCIIGNTVGIMSILGRYNLKNPQKLLSILKKLGEDLFGLTIPEEMIKELEPSHLILETNANIPLELMWFQNFFALKYAIGRRLRVRELPLKRFYGIENSRALIIAEGSLRGTVTEGDYLEKELNKLVETHYLRGKVTREEVISSLSDDYSIIHYAGHVRKDGLKLSDEILTSSDILTSMRGRPIVFINGCSSAGSPNTELVEAFLRAGALGYIGSLWDIHDTAAAELAADFYMNSRHHTLGEALRLAKEKAFREKNVAWLCFVLYGDPTLQLI